MNRKRVVFAGVLGLAAASLLFLAGAGVAAPGGGHGGGGHGGGGHGGGGHGGGSWNGGGGNRYHGGYYPYSRNYGYYGYPGYGIGIGVYPGYYGVYGPSYYGYDDAPYYRDSNVIYATSSYLPTPPAGPA